MLKELAVNKKKNKLHYMITEHKDTYLLYCFKNTTLLYLKSL